MSEPLFSVIIPTYNRAGLIMQTINSALNQTYGKLEVIVVDDGSTDATQEIIEKIDDNRLCYVKKEHSERAASRNCGWYKAKGDYVYFLDSDDILYPNHFEEARKFVLSNSTPPVFFLKYEFVNTKGKVIKQLPKIKGSLNKWLVKKGNILSCHGVFLKKDLISAFRVGRLRTLVKNR